MKVLSTIHIIETQEKDDNKYRRRFGNSVKWEIRLFDSWEEIFEGTNLWLKLEEDFAKLINS